jgi:methionyl-tRNA formyltransferase
MPLEKSEVGSQESPAALGELSVDKDRLFVMCGGRTVLELLAVQQEGKNRMAARDFIHGYHPKTGEQLETKKHGDTETQR